MDALSGQVAVGGFAGTSFAVEPRVGGVTGVGFGAAGSALAANCPARLSTTATGNNGRRASPAWFLGRREARDLMALAVDRSGLQAGRARALLKEQASEPVAAWLPLRTTCLRPAATLGRLLCDGTVTAPAATRLPV